MAGVLSGFTWVLVQRQRLLHRALGDFHYPGDPATRRWAAVPPLGSANCSSPRIEFNFCQTATSAAGVDSVPIGQPPLSPGATPAPKPGWLLAELQLLQELLLSSLGIIEELLSIAGQLPEALVFVMENRQVITV